MSADNNGGPAFPHPAWAGSLGMSLRDWFAGQAVVGFLASPDTTGSAGEISRSAYDLADAMLRAREGGAK